MTLDKFSHSKAIRLFQIPKVTTFNGVTLLELLFFVACFIGERNGGGIPRVSRAHWTKERELATIASKLLLVYMILSNQV